jgi:transposase
MQATSPMTSMVDDGSARGLERDPVSGEDWLPVAHAPERLPPWSTVYGYFRHFWQEGIWHRISMILLMQSREQDGKAESPTAGVVKARA